MMALKIFLGLLSLTLLSSCGSWFQRPQPIVNTEFVEREIPIQSRPKPVELDDIRWRVVTSENLDAFLEEIRISGSDQFVFMAISVRDYEKLSLNVDELRRYILQQKEIIVYYEDSIRGESEE